MSDNQCWRHTYIYLFTVKLLLHHLLSLLRDRHQSIDKQLGDTWYQLHHSSHSHTKEQYLLDVHLSQSTNQGSNNHTQYQWLTQHTELLLQSLCINIQLRESGNHIEALVHQHSKWCKALNKWLWDRNSLHTLIVALELRSRKVSHHQCVDIAHDSSKVSPCQTLVHHKVSHCTDKGEVPVVPQVDIYGTCGLGYQHQEVNPQTDGDNQRAYSRVIGHSCSSRPTHIEHAKLQIIQTRNLRKRATEVISQQGCYNAQTYKSHTHIKS